MKNTVLLKTHIVQRDPDASLRNDLEAQIRTLENKIQALEQKLQGLYEKMQTLQVL